MDGCHIQGNDKSDIFYGAYYGDILVGVMTFNSQRNMTKNVEGEYELSRYATRQGYTISGLASKVLKQFIFHSLYIILYQSFSILIIYV